MEVDCMNRSQFTVSCEVVSSVIHYAFDGPLPADLEYQFYGYDRDGVFGAVFDFRSCRLSSQPKGLLQLLEIIDRSGFNPTLPTAIVIPDGMLAVAQSFCRGKRRQGFPRAAFDAVPDARAWAIDHAALWFAAIKEHLAR